MWVKICGNTNLEDATLAVELGADAVGFVFAESKRQVTAAQVAAITAHLPEGVERVGVFCSRDAEEIAQTVIEAGLTAVQLHGGLDEGLLKRMAERFAGRVGIIQTLHWTIDGGVAEEPSGQRLAGDLQRAVEVGVPIKVLVDSKVGSAGGGTGVAYDWSAARSVFASAPRDLPLIAAGGLKPENVGEAVAQLGVWGVDVCSGVEASAGRKDADRMARFIANARAVRQPRSA